LTFSGLAVTADHYLVVGVLEPPGLLIFDLHAGGPPQQVYWPASVPFTPFDMAPMPGGGVWILDRVQHCYWALARNFEVIPRDQVVDTLVPEQSDAFQPVAGGEPRGVAAQVFPRGITLETASPLDAVDPIAIEALPDCTVLILDCVPGNYSQISRYRFAQRLGMPVSTQVMAEKIEEEKQAAFELIAHDFAFVSEHLAPDGSQILDRLYVVSANGNQTYAFNLEGDDQGLRLIPLPEIYLPMRLFSGKGLVSAGDKVYYDLGERWLALVEQRWPRYREEATFLSPIFDSRQPDCVWHRLMLDACIPPDTQVRVWSRAAEAEEDLFSLPWQTERMYLRGDGAELPFSPHLTGEGRGTWEIFFQSAVGRYLQLRLTLEGQGKRTPRLRALRAYYPRFSYAGRYLPAVYRQEPESASFLERFLANPEGFFTALEDKVIAVRLIFDVGNAPSETLDWLADWFGVMLDPAWGDERRRLLLRHIMLFFQYRGTRRGLRMALELALAETPCDAIFTGVSDERAHPGELRIVESFQTRRLPGVAFGDPTDLTGFLLPSENPPVPLWKPSQGAAVLNQRYQAAIGMTGPFPLIDPGGAASVGWQQFALETLGFVPSAGLPDTRPWQEFLSRRYGGVLDAFNTVYGLTDALQLASFRLIALPTSLPGDGPPLQDWYDFETVVLPMYRNAHHFSILLPMPPGLHPNSPAYQTRLALAQRMIQLEKPAHTTYNIKFFWALFRVGEARLGLDTQLDLGSRAPQLLTPLLLGQSFLAESVLTPGHPQNVTERIRVLGQGCRP
jgi:phage tail-like protein